MLKMFHPIGITGKGYLFRDRNEFEFTSENGELARGNPESI
jgi:hypothetical protein